MTKLRDFTDDLQRSGWETAIWNLCFDTPLIAMDRWIEADDEGVAVEHMRARWVWSDPYPAAQYSGPDKTIYL